ncbi:hypothetical protein [Comamonas testosteroni]|uniref:hypothetical protein n=1 Tax=Comamonas testosteroni TaxID=285 RepID=UPI001F3D9F18|nr:hypothetical protein [Comamonas testosteroni]
MTRYIAAMTTSQNSRNSMVLRRATDCGEGSDSGEDWGGGVTFRRMDRQRS